MLEDRINYMNQQGFYEANARTCDFEYDALMFQPRIIGALVLVSMVLQSAPLFLTLSAVLLWSALVPGLNPFERLYNRLVAARKGYPAPHPAPSPRRFAEAMGAMDMLLVGASLLAGWNWLAVAFQAVMVAGLAAQIFGSLCLGAYLFHVLTGNREFARQTLPWSRSAHEAAETISAEAMPCVRLRA